MREAELAAWSGTNSKPSTEAAHASEPVSARLPAAPPDSSERLLYLLLASLCALVLGYQVWATWHRAAGWTDFVQYVRQLLA